MGLQKPTLVLMDMDGTTVRHINPKLLNILERIDDITYGCASFFGQIFRIRKIRSPMSGIVNRGKKPRLFVHKAIHKVRRKSVEQIVEPCPGVLMLLDILKDNNIPIGLISNGLGKGYGYDILDSFDMKGYFVECVFREDMIKSKPHPDSIIRTAKKIAPNLDENDVLWYIGDREKDIKAALSAKIELKCSVEPIAYGINAAVAALKHGVSPENIVMNYEDFYDLLQDVFSKSKKNTRIKPPESKADFMSIEAKI